MLIKPDKTDTGGIRWYGSDKPAVTSVIDVIVKPYLEKWKRDKGAIEAKRISGEALRLGKHLHTIIEKLAAGEDPEYDPKIGELCTAAEHVAYKAGIKSFLDEWVDTVLATELPLESNKYGFGGTCDMYAMLKSGELAVIDFKTSKQLSREMGLQTWAYGQALLESGRWVDRRLVVQVKKRNPRNGRLGDIFVREFHDDSGDRDGFLGALALFRWVHASAIKKRLGIPE